VRPNRRARPPWRQARGKSMVSSVNSDTYATRIGCHQWEIDLRIAPGLPPGWYRRRDVVVLRPRDVSLNGRRGCVVLRPRGRGVHHGGRARQLPLLGRGLGCRVLLRGRCVCCLRVSQADLPSQSRPVELGSPGPAGSTGRQREGGEQRGWTSCFFPAGGFASSPSESPSDELYPARPANMDMLPTAPCAHCVCELAHRK